MPRVTVDLQQAIDDAKKRFSEAQDLHDHPLATVPAERERQRDRLIGLLTALDQQIITLEAIRDEKKAASVVVDAVTDQAVKEINDALAALHKVISRTETFQANLGLITSALGAAKKVADAVPGGTAKA